MEATEFLRSQHRKVETLLDRIMAVGDGHVREKQRLLALLGDALAVHTAIEERIFYPGVNRASTEDFLLRSLEEHLSVKRVLGDLLQMDEWATTFHAKVEVLDEQIRMHVVEEETKLFPMAEMLVPLEERVLMGRAMQRLADELASSSPRYDILGQLFDAAPLE